MTRWWKFLAVLAAWLGFGWAVQAQPGYPMPVGAARMPEPLGYVPGPEPALVPGAMNPLMAPPGPPDSLSLPASHTSAFQCENFPPETAWFASAGAMALQRQGLTRLPIAYYDEQNGRIDTGIAPIGILPVAMSLKEVSPLMHAGTRATVGFLFGNQAIELTGFYILPQTQTRERIDQGFLYLPFVPDNVTPFGFSGNNGIFMQVDRFQARFTDAVGNIELNYRMWNGGINQTEYLIGLRYMYEQERVDLYADDEYFVRDVFLQPDSRRQATYSVSTRNNLYTIQCGGEFSAPLPHEKLGWLWLTFMGKSAIGANMIQRTQRLVRGDGFLGFESQTTSVRLAGLYDVAAYLDIHILERLRVRAGYTALWATGVSAAGSQIEFDVTRQGQRVADRGSMFWHGPVLEMQFLF